MEIEKLELEEEEEKKEVKFSNVLSISLSCCTRRRLIKSEGKIPEAFKLVFRRKVLRMHKYVRKTITVSYNDSNYCI